jgi:hypothetical protein
MRRVPPYAEHRTTKGVENKSSRVGKAHHFVLNGEYARRARLAEPRCNQWVGFAHPDMVGPVKG